MLNLKHLVKINLNSLTGISQSYLWVSDAFAFESFEDDQGQSFDHPGVRLLVDRLLTTDPNCRLP